MIYRFLLFIVLVFFAFSCSSSTNTFKTLAEEDPELMVSMGDSLLSLPGNKNDTTLLNIIVGARLNIAQSYIEDKKFDQALAETNKALGLSAKNKQAQYYSYLVEGHINFKHGSFWKLWDAIGLYIKATQVMPGRGEPYYWIARSYEKKDDRDFDSIIEAYEKALSVLREGPLKEDAKKRISRVMEEKRTFESFWK